MYSQQYNPADVAVINALIVKNGLKAAQNAPETWEFATWNNSNPKNITKLNLNNRFLYGEASFAGLTQLKELTCNRNKLTKLDVTKCPQLFWLECKKNKLIKLDVTKCPQLYLLQCEQNILTKLDVTGCPQLYWVKCTENSLTELDVTKCPQLEFLICDNGVKKISNKETQEQRDREEQMVIGKNTSFSFFVQNYVLQEMNKWLKKGEFEKTDEWQLRISEDSRKVAELLQAAEQAYIAERSKNIPVGKMTLDAYDADSEMFLIRNSVHGNYLVHVPINEAPNFKNNWNSHIMPQYAIIGDQLLLTGYKYIPTAVSNNSVEPKENQIIANQPVETKPREQVIENVQPISNSVNTNSTAIKNVPNRQGEVSIGLSPAIYMEKDLFMFGLCGKLRVGIANPIRLEGSFEYYFPKTTNLYKSGIELSMWSVYLNMQTIVTKNDKFLLYPLIGLRVFGVKLSALGVSESKTFFGMNFGSGFDVKLSKKVYFNLELKYLLSFIGNGVGHGFTTSTGLIIKF